MTREPSMSETVENVTEPLGGGALLRQVREQAGVHVAALAVALKVPVRQIEALEQDRLDLLPDHTFARALAASICRHLRTDAQPILARLPQGAPRAVMVGEGLNEPFRASSAPGRSTLRERLVRPPVLVALGLLVAALAVVFLPVFDDSAPAPDAGVPAASTAPEAAPAQPRASSPVVIEPVTPLQLPTTPAPAPQFPAPAAPAAPPRSP